MRGLHTVAGRAPSSRRLGAFARRRASPGEVESASPPETPSPRRQRPPAEAPPPVQRHASAPGGSGSSFVTHRATRSMPDVSVPRGGRRLPAWRAVWRAGGPAASEGRWGAGGLPRGGAERHGRGGPERGGAEGGAPLAPAGSPPLPPTRPWPPPPCWGLSRRPRRCHRPPPHTPPVLGEGWGRMCNISGAPCGEC